VTIVWLVIVYIMLLLVGALIVESLEPFHEEVDTRCGC